MTITLDMPEVDHQFRRWFNEKSGRISEAFAKGYLPVIEDGGYVRRRVGTMEDGSPQFALLMDKPRIQRYTPAKWWSRRSPSVQARIKRLNPRLGEGEIPRGWRPAPTLHSIRMSHQVIGKREFIARFGRAAFDDMNPRSLHRSGKRVYVSLLAVIDLPMKGR